MSRIKFCPYCNLDLQGFKTTNIGNHLRWCELNPKRILEKQTEKKYKKKYCNLCGKEITGLSRRKRCDNCGHKHSEEMKKYLSKKRLVWLKENSEKHPWKRKDKFISKPCQLFKNYLDLINLKYVSEYNTYNETKRNFSIDIAFPDKKIGIEINGNQHYNKDGTLKQYYQKRHDIIEACGWKLLEIHYTSCFNENEMKKIITYYKQPDYSIYFLKYNTNDITKANKEKERLLNIKKHYEKRNIDIENRKNRILNYKIDFSKFGWVGQVAKLENISNNSVKIFMRKYLRDFYLKNCFIRKSSNVNYLK